MTEQQTMLLSLFLAPIYVVLLRHYIADPLCRLAKRTLPPHVAAILTKQRGN